MSVTILFLSDADRIHLGQMLPGVSNASAKTRNSPARPQGSLEIFGLLSSMNPNMKLSAVTYTYNYDATAGSGVDIYIVGE